MNFSRSSEIVLIPVNNVVPNVRQVRKNFDRQELEGLSQSIRENGLIHPITVRPLNLNDYEIIAGERRYRASIIAGLTTIPAMVIESSDERAAILSLTENLQKQSISFFEEAEAISFMIEKYSYDLEYIASILGKTTTAVSDLLSLLSIPKNLRKTIIKNNLTQQYAQALLKVSDEKEREKILNEVIEKKLNITQTSELINKKLSYSAKLMRESKTKMYFKDLKIFVNTLDHAVETMNKAGIGAQKEHFENNTYIRYTVTIPKSLH